MIGRCIGETSLVSVSFISKEMPKVGEYVTLEYDGRNSAIKQLIQVLFTLGAKEAEPDTKEAQSKMVKDSLTTAFDELYAGKARKNARNLFA